MSSQDFPRIARDYAPMSRRRALTLGAAAIGSVFLSGRAAAASLAAPPTQGTGAVTLGPATVLTRGGSASVRPTGPGTIRYEDLYRSGDDIRTVVAKAGPNLLTLPEGTFEVANFRDPYQAIAVAPSLKGIAGSGRNTIIRVKAGSSTYGRNLTAIPTANGSTNQLYVIRANDGGVNQQFTNFTIEGTGQGHMYNGIMVGNASKPVLDGLYLFGIPGDAAYPPGETFGINIWRGNGSVIRNVEVDGRRSDGTRYAASPIGYNDHVGGYLENCYLHHTKTGGGGIAYWQSSDCETHNVRAEYIGSGGGDQAGNCLNHERSTRITHDSPTLIVNRTAGGNTGAHIGWNNDTENGQMTIRNATWDNPGIGGGRLFIETWNPYGNGQKVVTAPTVLGGNGQSLASQVNWVH